MVQCPNCKSLLEYGEDLCPNCGLDLQQINKPQTHQEPQIKQFSCPYCNNVFSAESPGAPIEINCPLCRKKIIIE